ncbi:MFS transporter [Leifsonia shinshuensis]|nr:MFS transporter [Leifsonia shinshuensis]
MLGGAGLAAGVTVGALLAQRMLGGDQFAGLPAAALTLGSALTAFLVGRVSQRFGRRPGLGGGFLAGGLGAIGVVVAAAIDSPALLFIALFVYGAGTATNLQARYAGTDLALPARRATAASIALVSTTVGAVLGPNLVTPMGKVAAAWGIPELAGPFILAAAAYLAAGTALIVLLRPDPLLLSERLARGGSAVVDAAVVDAAGAGQETAPRPPTPPAPVPPPARRRPARGVVIGASVMVVAQIVMTAIMTMTPVHMQLHHAGLDAVGLVIGIHIAAMYLPSLVTGILVDRIGRTAMAVACGAALLLAGVTAAMSGDSLAVSVVALILLGLGWNFGIIAGTAMIIDATSPDVRARTQGSVDVLISLAGAGGSAMSGVVMAAAGYDLLGLGGAALALLLIPVVAIRPRRAGSLAG